MFPADCHKGLALKTGRKYALDGYMHYIISKRLRLKQKVSILTGDPCGRHKNRNSSVELVSPNIIEVLPLWVSPMGPYRKKSGQFILCH